MCPKWLPEMRSLHHEVAIVFVMFILLLRAVDGSRKATKISQLTESDGGEDRNTSRCLLSYSNMDRRELSKCK